MHLNYNTDEAPAHFQIKMFLFPYMIFLMKTQFSVENWPKELFSFKLFIGTKERERKNFHNCIVFANRVGSFASCTIGSWLKIQRLSVWSCGESWLLLCPPRAKPTWVVSGWAVPTHRATITVPPPTRWVLLWQTVPLCSPLAHYGSNCCTKYALWAVQSMPHELSFENS